MKRFLLSFLHAFEGIIAGFAGRNMRVHGLMACLAIILGFYTKISLSEWQIVLILIGLVMSAELVNTAIEQLADLSRDEMKLSYGATKAARDIAAGAVLILAIVSAIVGLTIFLPKLLA